MFQSKNKRYITRGIKEALPKEVQIFCWAKIDSITNIELDYLQIFEFEYDKKLEKLTTCHRQEIPEFQKEYVLYNRQLEIAVKKIYVIDNGAYQTMLLPEEY